MPLPESTTQSQIDTLPQPVSIPLPQCQPADPTSIVPWIVCKIQHRPSPQYHDPYTRPPSRPPDVTDPLDSQKDLSDNDLDRNVDIEENFPFQEGIVSEIYERLDMSYVQEPQEFKDLIDTTKLIQKFLPKQTGHRQNSRHYQEKGFKGYTLNPHHKGNSSRLSE